MSNETYEFCCDLVHETDDAYLVSDGENKFWIPKSQISTLIMADEVEMEITIPEWLAIEKGIV